VKILITGGRSQIGTALAERQLRLGNRVIVTASSAEGAAVLRASYAELGVAAEVVVFPLDPELPLGGDLEACLREGIDALVLNASTPIKRFKYVHRLTREEIHESIALNIEGNLRLLREVLPGMMERKFGRLVFVSSAMVSSGTSRHGLYCMTKSAMEALFLNVAVDYGRHNILANVLRPGIVRTERTKRFWRRPAYREKAERMIPQGKLGEPAQVAECFDPLLSPTSYMTGSILTVSGGLPLMNLSRAD
jgi:3-oxoacyl-[acyl-carrier protein] reductase